MFPGTGIILSLLRDLVVNERQHAVVSVLAFRIVKRLDGVERLARRLVRRGVGETCDQVAAFWYVLVTLPARLAALVTATRWAPFG